MLIMHIKIITTLLLAYQKRKIRILILTLDKNCFEICKNTSLVLSLVNNNCEYLLPSMVSNGIFVLQGIHTNKPTQPPGIVPRSVIIQPGLFIPFLANIFVSFQRNLGFRSATSVACCTERMIFLIRNDGSAAI